MSLTLVPELIEKYCRAQSHRPSTALAAIEKHTYKAARYPEMLVGPLEAAFLACLVRLVGAKSIIEVGTFTGYSALAMAEAMPAAGRLITLDIDPSAGAIAKKGWARSVHGKKIHQSMGHALSTLEVLKGPVDMCFIDADKINYQRYFDMCLARTRKGGLVVVDNTLWSGEVLKPRSVSGKAIARFNRKLTRDKRVHHVLLPLRDGVTLAVKK